MTKAEESVNFAHNLSESLVPKDTRIMAAFLGELLHHGRRAGIEKTTQIRVVSGETTFIRHI